MHFIDFLQVKNGSMPENGGGEKISPQRNCISAQPGFDNESTIKPASTRISEGTRGDHKSRKS